MSNSITHLVENGIPSLQGVTESFIKGQLGVAEYIYAVKDVFLEAACMFAGETFTMMNTMLRDSMMRKEHWEIVKTDTKNVITSIGATPYEKTLFKNKDSGERKYLVDELIGIEKYQRTTEDADAAMLSETVQTSYRKGGEAVSILDDISKNAVKEKIHSLEFPSEKDKKRPGRKRVVENLYIDADEDHISLQFQNKKGDLEFSKSGRKLNGAMIKLLYIYEGLEPEAPKSKRYRLINPHYFAGAYEGEKGNNELADEFYAFIDKNYDISKIKHIYVNSDCAGWIKAAIRRIHGCIQVLDEFHLNKYVLKMTRHVDTDGTHAARDLLLETIRRDTKEDFKSCVDMLMFHAGTDDKVWNRVNEGADYILNNWTAAKTRLIRRNAVCGSSTEGHVSHVLSSRMSTLPMGWSRKGADRMAHLRAYFWNGGNMLDLVRYQKEARVLPKAAGAENETISVAQMISSEHYKTPSWGKYVDKAQVSLSAQMKKWMMIGIYDYVWRLR